MLMMTKIALFSATKTAGPFGNFMRNAAAGVRQMAHTPPAGATPAPAPKVVPSGTPAAARPVSIAVPEKAPVVGQAGFMARAKGLFQGPEQRAANATARAHEAASVEKTLAQERINRGENLRRAAEERAAASPAPTSKREADLEILRHQASERPGMLGFLGRHSRLINPSTGALVGAGLSMGKDLITGNPDEEGKDQGVSLTKALGAAGAGAGLGMLGRFGANRFMRHGVSLPPPAPAPAAT